ncbi:DUF1127 domain-containing protein [Methylobacterium oryzihabitans]|uniref:DUF1127 domain-containing protein n=1 Tax=Methylobacterium oryzihabitans TaxID=2499852 RepID=A0A3S3U6I6_9HYPH|nr:DUF1127 domain-containing protein [Methylobacterium oryzihabitans]RVU16672.1 DUF1127 domain-containing protein [Methylobacterium oryzihabitans]
MTFGFAPLGVLSLAFGAARAVLRTATRVAVLWNRRQAIHRIAEFDDRMLKDIGLSRSDVSGALDVPWRHDPTEHLVDRRTSRRHPGRSLRVVGHGEGRSRDWAY